MSGYADKKNSLVDVRSLPICTKETHNWTKQDDNRDQCKM